MFYNFTIEIKNRGGLLGFTWLSGFFMAYVYKNTLLFSVIKRNLISDYFVATDVTEVFLAYFKLNIYLANHFFVLYSCYHLIIFFISALYYVEYFFFINIFFISLINLIFFTFFIHCVGIPTTWEFFIKTQAAICSQIIPIYFENRLYKLLEFYLTFFKFGVLSSFLFTALIFLSAEINKNLVTLKKNRSMFHFSLVIVIIILSPPDLLSFLSASSLFIIIFEFGILFNSLKT